MAADSPAAVLAAIVAAIDGLTAPVYDVVTPDAALPYHRIGNITTTDDSTKTENGDAISFEIHTFTGNPDLGRAACLGHMGEVYNVLHGASLAVTGFNAWQCFREFATVILEENDTIAHGVQRYRLNTEPV